MYHQFKAFSSFTLYDIHMAKREAGHTRCTLPREGFREKGKLNYYVRSVSFPAQKKKKCLVSPAG